MNFKGQEGIQGTALALVAAAVVMIIGIYIYSQIYSNINTSALSTQANATVNNINSTTYNAFNLLVVGLIILAAVAVLGFVFLLGRRG